MSGIALENRGNSLSIRVPMKLKKRGGRKEIIAPSALSSYATSERTFYQQALVVALARGHRWQEMLDSGQYKSVAHLARHVGVHPAYANRLMRLTLLAPDIVAAILEGREPSGFSLNALAAAIPEIWDEQRTKWGFGE